jgi:phage baseplate assembly protein W|tara:strand:- start:34 stop:540 length:507 start_codon:yes stop_codon:yes gene_type:complete
MAIRDNSRKPYKVDNDTKVKVGIDLPIRRDDISDGFFASTSTTIEAVKNNIRNLLQTNEGERFFQPTLGLNLRKFLFDNITDDTVLAIQDSILDKMEFWLPFVQVNNIIVESEESNRVVGANELRVKIIFNITQDPTTLDSVTINFSSDISESESPTLSGGGVGGAGY